MYRNTRLSLTLWFDLPSPGWISFPHNTRATCSVLYHYLCPPNKLGHSFSMELHNNVNCILRFCYALLEFSRKISPPDTALCLSLSPVRLLSVDPKLPTSFRQLFSFLCIYSEGLLRLIIWQKYSFWSLWASRWHWSLNFFVIFH